ncbi:SAM-dependent methyltransferase [Actinomadura bangladeshensis]|uniref:SAM-dependent methyltransferase n=1 Tax=Actinomadura bangladeshensis TaxID=453573 RepID=A0A6L9R0V1_9ACTN|nr:SAM-dependent methyltransferase [Actinomadura bangladeshensis]NEA29794.1 SAM-dependent methyltransferase [Actinomadura bangladeshensis]
MPEESSDRINTNIPHPARVYDAWLGGENNFAVDRAAAEEGLKAFPSTVKSVRANRGFLARAVEYLVAEAGIRQFLDIGTGLPAADNTHQVAQALAPECRIAYVDNDPIVLAHAEALLQSSEPGATDYIDADLRDPAKILQQAARTLDFTQPVAVMLIAVLHFIPDESDPSRIVRTLMDAVPPGSHLVVSHTAKDILPEEMAAFAHAMNKNSAEKVTLRDREQVTALFHGLDLLAPGVVEVSNWRPRSADEASTPAVLWAGMARKPTWTRQSPGA